MKTKFMKNEKGTSIVEFAIVLPLLLVILFGIIEFALLLYDKAMITNASREAARAGIVYRANLGGNYSPLSTPEMRTIATNYLQNFLIDFGGNTFTFTAASIDASNNILPQCASSGSNLAVTIQYPYQFLVVPNLVTSLAGYDPLILTAVTQMVCE